MSELRASSTLEAFEAVRAPLRSDIKARRPGDIPQFAERCRELIRLHALHCKWRFGSTSMFETQLSPEQLDRIQALKRVQIDELALDDRLDREIWCVQRYSANPSDLSKAKAAKDFERTGDPWAYWQSLFSSAVNMVHLPPTA